MTQQDEGEGMRTLTPSEAAILQVLLTRPQASREVLARYLPFAGLHSLSRSNKRGPRSVDVHICHIRRKLPRLPVETVRGEGWSIPKAAREVWTKHG